MKRHLRGVTLIELMIVVVVLAILASIALPSYRRYMMRTNRTEATAALLQLRIAQEKFFLQNSTYATLAQLDDPPPGGLGLSLTTERQFYTIDFAAWTNNSYTARATAANGQVDDTDCATLTLTDSGARGSSPGARDTCWK